MKFQRHLFLNEVTLPPSAEWMDSSPGWRFLRVSHGAAYWLAHGAAKELAPGDLVVVAPAGEGSLRASQLGEVKLQFFHFCPELLSGFLTLSSVTILRLPLLKANRRSGSSRPATRPTGI